MWGWPSPQEPPEGFLDNSGALETVTESEMKKGPGVLESSLPGREALCDQIGSACFFFSLSLNSETKSESPHTTLKVSRCTLDGSEWLPFSETDLRQPQDKRGYVSSR